MILCDASIQMDTSDVDTTPIIASIMANGTHGNGLSAFTVVGTAAAVTINSAVQARLDSVRLRAGGDVFTPSFTHRRILFDNSASTTYLQTGPANTTLRMSVAGFWTPGPPDAGAGGQAWDVYRLDNVLGHFAVFQHWNGNAPGGGGYAVNLHCDPGGTPTTVGNIVVTQNTVYWIELWADWSLGGTNAAQMALFNASTGVQVGTTLVANTHATQSNMSTFRFGQVQTGTNTGTSSAFEGIIADTVLAQFPLGPTGGFEKSFIEYSRRPAPFKPGIAK